MAGLPTGAAGAPAGTAAGRTEGICDVAGAAVATAAAPSGWSADGEPAGIPVPASSKSSPLSLAGVSSGIRNDVPHLGHFPRFPARKALTFILCPLGQRNLMPIELVTGKEAPVDSDRSRRPFIIHAATEGTRTLFPPANLAQSVHHGTRRRF